MKIALVKATEPPTACSVQVINTDTDEIQVFVFPQPLAVVDTKLHELILAESIDKVYIERKHIGIALADALRVRINADTPNIKTEVITYSPKTNTKLTKKPERTLESRIL